jgi:N-acetylneuraminic acid mutarotase
MGGYGGGMQNAVYYAKVNSDGSTGDWATSPNSLPAAAYEAGAVVHDGYLYFVGGMDSDSHALDSVYYAKLNSDGSVGSWNTSANHMPQGIDDAGVTTTNGHIYVMGGSNNSGFTNTIYHASFNGDGSLSSWTTDATALPQALDGVTAAATNGYLYIAGGNTDVETTQDGAYYAKVNTDGSVAAWTAGPALLQPLRYADSIIRGNYLYIIAGQNDGLTQNTVYYAPLNFPSSQPTQSVPGTPNNQPVTITTPAGTTISSVSVTTPPTTSGTTYSYPLGLTSFTLTTNSIENQITLVFQTDLTPSQVVAQKYNNTSQTYSDIPGAVVTDTTLNGKHALQLTYTITDGGPLDEDGALNGVVVDPVGLAQISHTSAYATAPSTGYGNPGSKTPVLITALSASALVAGTVLQSAHRRRALVKHR